MNDTGWSSYEQEVFDCFRTYFPEADIRKNVRLKGRYSKRMRQIDILITETTPVGPSRIVIDAKLHNRKLNVKAVEEFEGFVNDIGANKGLLISTGFYPAFTDTSSKPIMGQEVCHGNTQEVLTGVQARSRSAGPVQ